MGQRKPFTPEFKREAVQLLESGSRPGSAIAGELGIARNQRYKWQTELRARGTGAFPGSGARKERTTEVASLKRELARVTEERDIVKKRQCTSPRMCDEVRVHTGAAAGVPADPHVRRAAGESERLLCVAPAIAQYSHTDERAADRADARPASADAGSLGARKMWQLLRREGFVCGRHRVARLRRRAGIVALRRRRDVRTMQVRQYETPAISRSCRHALAG